MNDQSVVNYFDGSASSFYSNSKKLSSFKERYDLILNTIRASDFADADATVADIGCGAGVLSELLLKNGYRVDCIDGSANMLRLTESLLGKYDMSMWTVLQSAIPLGSELVASKENAYDVIVLSSVLEYIDEWRHTLAQCQQMMRKGACLIATFPNGSSLYRIFETSRLSRVLWPQKYIGFVKRLFIEEDVRGAATDLGLRVLDIRYFGLPKQNITKFIFGKRRDKCVASMFLVVMKK